MAKKTERHINPNEERLMAGLEKVKEHALFSRLEGWISVSDKQHMGKESAAYVEDGRTIYLNKDYNLSPGEWAFVIAHCKLHLAFGHFEAEKMPGYYKENVDGTKDWQVSCNKDIWNTACDIYVSKFLYDIKFGTPTVKNPIDEFGGGLSDELKIYDMLVEKNYNPDMHSYGTCNQAYRDMHGLENPIVYDKNYFRYHAGYSFSAALSASVSATLHEASGRCLEEERLTRSDMAANWFINHFPLLGGLASNFKIVEDYIVCNEKEISIAAVDVDEAVIYVNPAAGLKESELRFVLAHEYLHAGLEHRERCLGRDMYIWNVACDFVINGWLVDMEIGQMPERGLMYDEKFKNESAENIYDEIIRNIKEYDLETFRGYGKGDIIKGKSGGFGYGDGGKVSVDDFCRNALRNGLEYHQANNRGYIPAGLIQEIRALSMPPIPWDVKLAKWFDTIFQPIEKQRTYARPSRRQGSTPDIPRPSYVKRDLPDNARTFGVVVDTSGSMSAEQIGLALGAIASYSAAKEVPFARVVFCDAAAYDAGYLAPEDIAGRVCVKGRGGTILQPGVDLLETSKDFPKDGPILIITDGEIENNLEIKRKHAYLIPEGARLPFRTRAEIFRFPVSGKR